MKYLFLVQETQYTAKWSNLIEIDHRVVMLAIAKPYDKDKAMYLKTRPLQSATMLMRTVKGEIEENQ